MPRGLDAEWVYLDDELPPKETSQGYAFLRWRTKRLREAALIRNTDAFYSLPRIPEEWDNLIFHRMRARLPSLPGARDYRGSQNRRWTSWCGLVIIRMESLLMLKQEQELVAEDRVCAVCQNTWRTWWRQRRHWLALASAPEPELDMETFEKLMEMPSNARNT